MTDTSKAVAILSWSLDVECPVCNWSFDCAEDDDDNTIANAVFTNKWDALKGREVVCPKCNHEFDIDRLEY